MLDDQILRARYLGEKICSHTGLAVILQIAFAFKDLIHKLFGSLCLSNITFLTLLS